MLGGAAALTASLTFVTPYAALVAVSALVPLAAFVFVRSRHERGRRELGLPDSPSTRRGATAALLAVPLLLGLAAAGPAWSHNAGRRVRTDAQAIFVFDTSRSMAASSHLGAPTRMAKAKAAAIELRNDALADVPSGVASLTTQLLPHIFPSSSLGAFDSTVNQVIGVERPPPPALEIGLTGTTFRPLSALRNSGYFDPATKYRYAILLTDGESAQYDPEELGQSLIGANSGPALATLAGGPQASSASSATQAPVHLYVVRVGGASDRIYHPDGTVETAYRPDPSAAEGVQVLARDSGGKAFTSVAAAADALRRVVEHGSTAKQGVRPSTVSLAPYVALAALLSLGLLMWSRNLAYA